MRRPKSGVISMGLEGTGRVLFCFLGDRFRILTDASARAIRLEVSRRWVRHNQESPEAQLPLCVVRAWRRSGY
jgi:hypothetical protein